MGNYTESPWLTPKEAAAYCKISLSLFNQLRGKIPLRAGGTRRRPRFHRDELDHWMRLMFETYDNEIKRCPVTEAAEIEKYPIKIKEIKHKATPLS